MGKMTSAILIASSFALVGSALAQSSPSADSIINSLTPRAGVGGSTRGIRPLNPNSGSTSASPATPAVARPNTRAPGAASPAASPGMAAPQGTTTAAEAAPSVNLTVQFANNSAELTPAAIHTLDQLGQALSSQALSSYKFRIEGHTDTLGNPERNMTLSEQRANAVVDYLVNKFHLDRSRLEAVGMGETHLLVPTHDQVPEPRNRRVTVVNVGA